MSNLASWVRTQMGAGVHLGVRQIPVGPVDDDFVGVGEAGGGGEDGAGVADGDVVAEKASGLAEGGREVDGAEDQHAGAGRVGVDEDGQLLGAGAGVPADLGPAGTSGAQECAGLCRHRPVLALAAQGSVVCAAVAEQGERAPEQGFGAVDDLGHGGGPSRRHLFEDRDEVGPGCRIHTLDQDLDLAAAGQTHSEGVVVGVAEAGPCGGGAVRQHLSAKFVDGSFDAAS